MQQDVMVDRCQSAEQAVPPRMDLGFAWRREEAAGEPLYSSSSILSYLLSQGPINHVPETRRLFTRRSVEPFPDTL
jgi:hypothetical protein